MIARALKILHEVAAFEPTMERQSLVAATFKRRALVSLSLGQAGRVRRDLIEMRKAYEQALRVGRMEAGAGLYYPALNYLAAEVALGVGAHARRRLHPEVVKIVRTHLSAKAGADADFWSVVGNAELEQYQAIIGRKLGASRAHLERLYRDLHAHATSTRMWASVYDTAALVLGSYVGPASAASSKEREDARALLTMLRGFAHPDDGQ